MWCVVVMCIGGYVFSRGRGFQSTDDTNKAHESVQITKINHNNQQTRGSSSRGLVPNLVRYCRWVKPFLFQIVKQILVILVVHLFLGEAVFWSMEHRPPPPWYATSFWYVINCHVIHLPCYGSCISQGGTTSYKKKYKALYSLIKKCNERQKISLNKIWYIYTALIQENIMFPLLNKCQFWFNFFSWTNDKNNGEECTLYR